MHQALIIFGAVLAALFVWNAVQPFWARVRCYFRDFGGQ
jgi:hypothetical protein